MGHIPLVKRMQDSCKHIYFLHALSPFLNHTYTERLSPPPSLQSCEENDSCMKHIQMSPALQSVTIYLILYFNALLH
jgi:hypothetical protein